MTMLGTNIAQEAPPLEQALPIGAVLSDGQFTITDHLGAGGFGITYRAQDNVLGRTIVIKECFPEDFCLREGLKVFARSTTYIKPVRSIVSMFMHEARSLAQLRHSHIVGVHGAFEENETAYMVLDLIDGPDLLEILESGERTLPPRDVRAMLLHLLDAIGKVHDLDLLHRDISPDNIIIEKSGDPVLIDFGAARADASRRTRAVSSMLVVKDGYSPQEFYVAGAEQGPSSDLYALAATFYHVLTGEAPPNSQSRMIEIAGHKPDPCLPLAGRVDGYDDAFLKAIDQAMSIHPNDRLQSAAVWRDLINGPQTGLETQGGEDISAPDQPLDRELERCLSALVEETNIEVRKSRLIAVEKVTAAPPPEKPSKPEWVEEFNRESLALSEGISAQGLAPKNDNSGHVPGFGAEGAAVVVEPKPETERCVANWIEKAVEKQERLRREQAAALDLPAIQKESEPALDPDYELSPLDGVVEPATQQGATARSWNLGLGVFACVLFYFCSAAFLQGL